MTSKSSAAHRRLSRVKQSSSSAVVWGIWASGDTTRYKCVPSVKYDSGGNGQLPSVVSPTRLEKLNPISLKVKGDATSGVRETSVLCVSDNYGLTESALQEEGSITP
jgi:hypothetical protein